MFFSSMYVFLKVYRYCEIFITAILSLSFKQIFWKKSVIYTFGDSALLILMLMLSSKKSYPILYLYILEKLSYVADFFYDNVFYTLYFFNCSTLFFIKLFFFFWKTQNISESMFLQKIFIKVSFLYKLRTKLPIKIT